jgi:hypothetical protein
MSALFHGSDWLAGYIRRKSHNASAWKHERRRHCGSNRHESIQLPGRCVVVVIIVKPRSVVGLVRRVNFEKVGMDDSGMIRSVARMNVFKRSHGKRQQQRKTRRERCQQAYPICGGFDQTFTIFTPRTGNRVVTCRA